jgi:hypothetical protein
LFNPKPLELKSSLKTVDSSDPDPFPVRKLRMLLSPDPSPVDVDVDVAGEASPCSAAGTAVITCDNVVCVPALAAPVVAVVAGGVANGVNVDAAAEDPA